jgi:hypothetical protein
MFAAGRGDARMREEALWALMQRVETLRYRAERIETAAAYWSSPDRDVAFDAAALLRRHADQIYASSPGRSA